ncbi:MAG: RecX family transcriptional regulator [Acidobacteria bacterium]|nr:RecX family transcriptional regulator [Acidobacteriota bacterium]
MTKSVNSFTMKAMAVTPYEKTMKRALNLLSFKPRTVAEMRERLMEKVWAEATVVEQVIARLKELGYLNDEQLAISFASSRLTFRPLGKTRLRRDLQRRKLPSEITEQTLDQLYEGGAEEELIDRALNKRLKLKGAPTTPEAAKKLFDYLMRRGFSYDLVRRKVREAGKGSDSSEEIELD